jgi:hypothetical protein
MAKTWTDEFSFTTGAVWSKELGYLVASNDELAERDVAHSVFLMWKQGSWQVIEPPARWICSSVCVSNQSGSEPMLSAIGQWGEVMSLDSWGQQETRMIQTRERPIELHGPLRRVRAISGEIYAVGTDRQVYKRSQLGEWISLVKDLDAPGDSVSSLEGIAGFSPAEIYAVGIGGEIWRFDGNHWHRMDSPTNHILNDICCSEEGSAYACGRDGTLLVGREDRWRVVNHGSTEEALWSVCDFRGHIYVSTLSAVYRLEGEVLKRVDFESDVPKTCYHLSATSYVLWSIGAKDVLALYGDSWFRID